MESTCWFYWFNFLIRKNFMLNKPIFKKMKNKSLWTVSSNKKIPLDLQWFIEHKDEPKAIKGAKYQDERSLGTYYELEEHIPNHANATYYYQMNNEDYLDQAAYNV